MFFRGTEIQRRGHGTCDPPFDPTHSNDSAVFGDLRLTRTARRRPDVPDGHQDSDTEVAICRRHCETIVAEPYRHQATIHLTYSRPVTKGLASPSRERVAYVMEILGNRGRSPGNGGDAPCLFHDVVPEKEGVAPHPEQRHRRAEHRP